MLQRNFQGYSTHGGCDLVAFGVSSISAIDLAGRLLIRRFCMTFDAYLKSSQLVNKSTEIRYSKII